MKRTTALALLGLACLMAVPSIAHARYRDGMNLYQYVGSAPVQHVDPIGLQRIKGKHLGSTHYGDWDITQNNRDAPRRGLRYSSSVVIKFIPNKKTVCCDEIAFIQAFQTLFASGKPEESRKNFKDRMTSTGWMIDRINSRKLAWYGYNNDGSHAGSVTPGSAPNPLVNAVLRDSPSYNLAPLTWSFETVAICKKGKDEKKVYGALTWGFDADNSGKLKSHTPKAIATHSEDFTAAMYMWNMQALGPAGQRNHPNQELIDINYWGWIWVGGMDDDWERMNMSPDEWREQAKKHWAADPSRRGDMWHNVVDMTHMPGYR